MTARLWPASLLVCGLFVGEDPTIVGVRAHVSGSAVTKVALDVVLATVMIAYNFASSRYVVSATSTTYVIDAMAVVDQQRAERIARIPNTLVRTVRSVVSHLNPFDLLKRLGEKLGQSVDHVSTTVQAGRLHRTAELLEDLGAVNVLGVPGATLALSSSGCAVTRRRTMRHCVLFVASWFIGIRLIGALIGVLHEVPLAGPVLQSVTGAIGVTFATLTDVTHPLGLLTIALMIAAIVRYSRQVERVARAAQANADAGAAA